MCAAFFMPIFDRSSKTFFVKKLLGSKPEFDKFD